MSAQVLSTDVLVPEPEHFSKAAWEEKQPLRVWMPFSQPEACTQVEQP